MYKIEILDFDMNMIASSGQCFRTLRISDQMYSVTAFNKYLEIKQNGTQLEFSCDKIEFHQIWENYFDLATDYGVIKQSIDEQDDFLTKAAVYGSGIRILKQDLWEMIVSFIISQNNNIPRIKSSIEALCTKYGEHCCTDNGIWYYTFPLPERIAKGGNDGMQGIGLGYRDKYILSMAEKCSVEEGKLWMEELRMQDYNKAFQMLTGQFGIGRKVADCICLFALHKIDAFPEDTHIKQILNSYYPLGFPYERYQGYAGVLQQYMFYYKVNNEKKKLK